MKKYWELQRLLDSEITANKEEFTKLNDYMALHPEPSGEEYETSKMLIDFLRSKGYTVEAPFCGFDCAFHAVHGENHHTHKAAVFCEYDALPEVGHACGHCLSGSIKCPGQAVDTCKNCKDCKKNTDRFPDRDFQCFVINEHNHR